MSTNIRVQRICQHCGNDFTARTTVTKYCGDTCAKKAYKVRKRNEKIRDSNKETKEIIRKPLEQIKVKEFLTVNETAILLGCSKRTAYRLIKIGTIKATNLSERMTRIKREEIDKLLI